MHSVIVTGKRSSISHQSLDMLYSLPCIHTLYTQPCAAPGCSNEVSEDTKPSKAWKCSKQVPRASNWAERHTFCDTCIAKAAKKKNCPSCGALPR